MTYLETYKRLSAEATPGPDWPSCSITAHNRLWSAENNLSLFLRNNADAVAKVVETARDLFEQGDFCDQLPKDDRPCAAILRSALAALDAGTEGR